MIIKTKAGKYPRYKVVTWFEILGGFCLIGAVWQVVWFIISTIKHF